MLNRAGDRTSLWIPHPLSCSSESGTHSHPERMFWQEALHTHGEMAPETKIPEVCQYAVLPHHIVSFFFEVKKIVRTHSLLSKAFPMNISK